MKTKEQILECLMMFTGTERYYKHPFGIMFTDGVKFLADECQCYWLIDIVASYQFEPKVKEQEFQVYKLKLNEDKSAIINIEDGDYNIITTQNLEFTHIPYSQIEIRISNGVCKIPSEH